MKSDHRRQKPIEDIPILVSLNLAAIMTSMSRSRINTYRVKGRFPDALDLGDRRVALVKTDVMDLRDGRSEASPRPTITPRLIGRKERAEYCGIGELIFSLWVSIHKMPPEIPGTRKWENRAIDARLKPGRE